MLTSLPRREERVGPAPDTATRQPERGRPARRGQTVDRDGLVPPPAGPDPPLHPRRAPRRSRSPPTGRASTFLRSRGGTDAVTCLWTLDPLTGAERLVADPRTLETGGDEDLPPEERARRERAREQAGGIVAYATDRAGPVAAFALSGRLVRRRPRRRAGAAPASSPPGRVVDPGPTPPGRRIAYVSGGALHVHDLATALDHRPRQPPGRAPSPTGSPTSWRPRR